MSTQDRFLFENAVFVGIAILMTIALSRFRVLVVLAITSAAGI